DGAPGPRHAAPADQRAAAHAGLLQAGARPRQPGRTALSHQGLRQRACAAGGAAHAVRPSHPALRGAVSGRPGLSAAASGRADVAEPRVTAMSKKVIITDRMQLGYVYWRTEP